MPVASSKSALGPVYASSEPRRRSFSAERATHTRNRYRTARKPNFRPTATGSSSILSSPQVEGDARRAELDDVPRLEGLGAGGFQSAAVDLDAVGRAEVVDDPRAARRAYLGVVARHVGVVEHDVAVARAPQDRPSGPGDDRAPVRDQPGAAAARIGLAQRLRHA